MYKRIERLNSLFLKEINLILQKNPRLNEKGLLTITGVKLFDEGKFLKIYFSAFSHTDDIEKIQKNLESLSFEIKTILKKRLRLKIIPNLIFEYDQTPQKAQKIEEILKKIDMEK